MAPLSPAVRALADRLARYEAVVEIGIGRRPEVARLLAAGGTTVIATDVVSRPVPPGVRFVRDDALDFDPGVYRSAEAIYALNCPPELHRPVRAIARSVDVPFLFTTLGTDPPAVPVRKETLPGETLFEARIGRSGRPGGELSAHGRSRTRRVRTDER